jgi:hypothetical protein
MPSDDTPRNRLERPDTNPRNRLVRPAQDAPTPKDKDAATPPGDKPPSPAGNTVESTPPKGRPDKVSPNPSDPPGGPNPAGHVDQPPFVVGVEPTKFAAQHDGPPRFFFEMGAHWHHGNDPENWPDFQHELWKLPNVHLELKVWPALFENATEKDIADDAVNMFRWFKGRVPRSSPTLDRWSFCLFTVGRYHFKNSRYLLNHPDDRPGNSTRFNAPWAKAGIDWNRAWGNRFWPLLAANFDQFNVPLFDFLSIGSENGPGDDQSGYNTPDGPGWIDKALEDARASSPDHLVDGEHTFAERWASDRRPDGSPFPRYNPDSLQGGMPPIRDPRNHDARERYAGLRRGIWDWSRFAGVIEPMQRSVPDMPAVEYQAHADGLEHQILQRPGPSKLGLYNMRGVFHTPWQGPDWYGGTLGYAERGGTHDNYLSSISDDWETPSNWIKHYPKPESSPFDELSFAQLQCGRRLIYDTRFTRRDRPLCPWVSLTYCPDDQALEKMYLFIQYAVALGVRRFTVWEQDYAHHPTTASRWHTLITRLNRWYETL